MSGSFSSATKPGAGHIVLLLHELTSTRLNLSTALLGAIFAAAVEIGLRLRPCFFWQ